jgi:hypothetical protein
VPKRRWYGERTHPMGVTVKGPEGFSAIGASLIRIT